MRKVKFWQIKSEIRILGLDDGPFKPHSGEEVPLVGTIFRGGKWIDGVLCTHIKQDGTDATERVIDMINRSRHKDQLRVVMTDGVTFAGFNVLNIRDVFEKTGLPVISVTRELPNMRDVEKAIRHLPNWRQRLRVIKSAGKIYPVETRKHAAPIYIQFSGMEREDAQEVVKLSSTRSLVPEPIRVSHLIATALVRGESSGRV